MVLAHGLAVRFRERFDKVVEALNDVDDASNVYLEVLDTSPRVAVAIGEKFFFRASNYASVSVIVIEDGDSTIVKTVSSGSREKPFDLFDLGTSKDYTYLVVEDISTRLGKDFEVIAEIEYLDRSKSELLHTPLRGHQNTTRR